jgi:hypothetical protein
MMLHGVCTVRPHAGGRADPVALLPIIARARCVGSIQKRTLGVPNRNLLESLKNARPDLDSLLAKRQGSLKACAQLSETDAEINKLPAALPRPAGRKRKRRRRPDGTRKITLNFSATFAARQVPLT